MPATKYLKGECALCGGHIEFPVEAAGTTADCPHCGKQTELLLAQPKDQPAIPARIVIWTLIAILVLVAGFGAALYALKRAQRWAERQKRAVAIAQTSNTSPSQPEPPAPDPSDPIAKAEFHISEIKLEKDPGTSVVHAAGTLENVSTRTRYGVTLEFDVFNAEGKKIGTAHDYQNAMDPKSKWNFHAPIVQAKATMAKATAVTEQQ